MIKRLNSILVPVDFFEPSLKAVRYAHNLAVRIEANIILLHVIRTSGLIADFFANGDELVKMTAKAKDKLTDIANSFQDNHNVKITSLVERGKPYDVILNISAKEDVRMIILGENHQGMEANKNLGTTVYQVSLQSRVPVLTLKGDTENMKNEIVVPLDLTTKTSKQLFSALAYGLNYNAKIHLVSAVIGGIKIRESRIYRKLKQAKHTLNANDVDATIKLFPKSNERPFNKVLEYANEINAGMILVMTHNEGYSYDNYIGAFAHHIINKSTVPVLSLTSAATEDEYTSVLSSFVDPLKLFKRPQKQ